MAYIIVIGVKHMCYYNLLLFTSFAIMVLILTLLIYKF